MGNIYEHQLFPEMKFFYRDARDSIEKVLSLECHFSDYDVDLSPLGESSFDRLNRAFLDARRKVTLMQMGFKELGYKVNSAGDLKRDEKKFLKKEIKSHQKTIEGKKYLGTLFDIYLKYIDIHDFSLQ